MDWSTFPADLVRLVSGRLHDPLDFLHLRAVCRSCRSAAASPPPFLPWLLARPCAAHPGDSTTAALSFFSLASGASRSVAVPSSSHLLLGPTRSHLLLSDSPHLLLLNPLTGVRLPLPDSPFPASSPVIQGYLVPTADHSPAPVVLYNAKKLFFHFRHPKPAGDGPIDYGYGDSWTELPVPGLVAENMYHNGKLFVCDDQGYVTVFDASTLAVVGVAPPPVSPPSRDAFHCTALVPSGDELLCVIRHFGMDGRGELMEVTGGLVVYRLEMEIGKGQDQLPPLLRWVQMRSIGDRMLFIGLFQGFSFNTTHFPGFKRDSIYFFKLEREKRSCIYRFNMEDGRTEELPGPWMHAGTWFVPSLS